MTKSTSLLVIVFLIFSISIQAQWEQIGEDINGESAGDFSGSTPNSVSLSTDGLVLAIGADSNDDNGGDSGHVRIYNNIGGIWTQIGEDIDGEATNDHSGTSVSLSSDGSIVAIGAHVNDGNGSQSGHVRVYQNIDEIWTQIGEDIDGEGYLSFFGYSISLSSDGQTVAVGAPQYSGDDFYSYFGQVRIYNYTEGIWTQIGENIEGNVGDQLGTTVSLSSNGSIVAIGAPLSHNEEEEGGESNGPGYVRIYQNINGTWTQISEDINGETDGDFFGEALSLSSDGSTVAIGSYENDGNGINAGHVRIYKNQEGVWAQIGEDIDGETEGDESGRCSLNADGTILAIGSPHNGEIASNAGHVRIYQNINETWTQIGENIDGETEEDYFGSSVNLSSNGLVLAIGAIIAPYNGGEDGDGDGDRNLAGRVRIYENTTLGVSEIIKEVISIYPNPFNDVVTISSKSKIISAQIIDVLGNTVKTITQPEGITQINLTNFSNGMYFLNVESDSNQKKTIKLIKG